jgi:hypothetical protein
MCTGMLVMRSEWSVFPAKELEKRNLMEEIGTLVHRTWFGFKSDALIRVTLGHSVDYAGTPACQPYYELISTGVDPNSSYRLYKELSGALDRI